MEILIALLLFFLLILLFFHLLPFLIPLFLILLALSVYRSYKVRKQFQQHAEDPRPHDPRGQDHEDVIDVEYTEETVDDERQGRS